jgi:hypothetical protein
MDEAFDTTLFDRSDPLRSRDLTPTGIDLADGAETEID